jgi:hypothetical protein
VDRPLYSVCDTVLKRPAGETASVLAFFGLLIIAILKFEIIFSSSQSSLAITTIITNITKLFLPDNPFKFKS